MICPVVTTIAEDSPIKVIGFSYIKGYGMVIPSRTGNPCSGSPETALLP